ncbi:MAG: hypothetical protein ACI39H_02940 [Lachnospiraceae bacterium]
MGGRDLWRQIRFITNKHTMISDEIYFDSQEEWYQYRNKKVKTKFSYNWCLDWVNTFSTANVWDDLYMKEPYLKACLKKRNIKDYEDLQRQIYTYCERYNIKYTEL